MWLGVNECFEWPVQLRRDLGKGPANGRRCYYVTPSRIDWAHTQNDHIENLITTSYNQIYNILSSVRRSCLYLHSERMTSIVRRTIQRVHGSGVFRRCLRNTQVSLYRCSMVEVCLIIRWVYCHAGYLSQQWVSNVWFVWLKKPQSEIDNPLFRGYPAKRALSAMRKHGG